MLLNSLDTTFTEKLMGLYTCCLGKFAFRHFFNDCITIKTEQDSVHNDEDEVSFYNLFIISALLSKELIRAA